MYEVIIGEAARYIITYIVREQLRYVVTQIFGENVPGEYLPHLERILVGILQQESGRRTEAIFGNLDIIDICPDTGAVLETPLLPAKIEAIKEALITSPNSFIRVNDYGEVQGITTVVEHRPFMTTSLEDYTVAEGLMFIIILLLVINAVKTFFVRLW